jgi:4-hydroxybenzoate polyprenyltransferase
VVWEECPLFGIEGAVMPLSITGLISLLLLAIVSEGVHGDPVVKGMLATSPFWLIYILWRGLMVDRRNPKWKIEILRVFLFLGISAITGVIFFKLFGQPVVPSFN